MKASNKKEQKKSWFVDDDSDNDNADGNDQKEVTARDEGMQLKMKNMLKTLYDDVVKRNKQKAQRTFQQFTNSYAKYEVAFKFNSYPRSLCKITMQISDAFVETTNKVKQFGKLMNEWNNFISRFKAEIDSYAQNLEEGNENDEYEYEEDEEDQKSKNLRKGKTKKSNDIIVIGQRLIHKCETSREKGQKPTISVSKLYDTAKMIKKDSSLRLELISEAVKMLTDTNEKDPLLTKGQWEVALGLIDLCKEQIEYVLPILQRLTVEIVQRPRSSQKDFPETEEILKLKPKLIEIIQNEINSNRDEIDPLKNENCFDLYNTLFQVFNLTNRYNTSNNNDGENDDKNIYNDTKFIDYVIDMFGSLEKSRIKIGKEIKSSTIDIIMFLVINLASLNHSEEAAKLFDVIPRLTSSNNTSLQFTYAARSRVAIGESAFKSGHYVLASKYLSQFDKVSQIPKQIGQSPIFDKLWPVYDANEISIFRQISDELIKIQENINQFNSEKVSQSTFSVHFQNLQSILNKSTEFNLKLPEHCEKDVKDMIALTFLVSSSNHSINDVSTKYLLENFSIQKEQFQFAAESVENLKQGNALQFDFLKKEDKNDSNSDIQEKCEKIIPFVQKYVC